MNKNNKNRRGLVFDTYNLRKKGFPVNNNKNLIKLGNLLIKNLILYKGLGLSSIQLKTNVQVYCIYYGKIPCLFWNIVISSYTKCRGYANTEACLSIPKINFRGMLRYCNCSFYFTDSFKNLNTVTRVIKALPLFIHETDQLNGYCLLKYL